MSDTAIADTSIGSGSAPGLRMVGGLGQRLDSAPVRRFVGESFAGVDLDGKRVCLVVPDGIRTCPLPLLLGAVRDGLAGRAREVKVVIALGTPHGMRPDHLASHLGYPVDGAHAVRPGWQVFNTSRGCRRRSPLSARCGPSGSLS